MFGEDFDRGPALELMRESAKIKTASAGGSARAAGPSQQPVASLLSAGTPPTWSRSMDAMVQARNPMELSKANERVSKAGGGRGVARTVRANVAPLVSRQNPGRIAKGVSNTQLSTPKLTGMSKSKTASGLSDFRKGVITKLANKKLQKTLSTAGKLVSNPKVLSGSFAQGVKSQPWGSKLRGGANAFKEQFAKVPTLGSQIKAAPGKAWGKFTGTGAVKGAPTPTSKALVPYNKNMATAAFKGSPAGKLTSYAKRTGKRMGQAAGIGAAAAYGGTHLVPGNERFDWNSKERLKAALGGAVAGASLGAGWGSLLAAPLVGAPAMKSWANDAARAATPNDPRGGLFTAHKDDVKKNETGEEALRRRVYEGIDARNAAAKKRIRTLEAQRQAKAGDGGNQQRQDKFIERQGK